MYNNINQLILPLPLYSYMLYLILPSPSVQYRAWARPEAVNQTEYALSVGTRILTYFEDYFGIPFPLPKQGTSSVPSNTKWTKNKTIFFFQMLYLVW